MSPSHLVVGEHRDVLNSHGDRTQSGCEGYKDAQENRRDGVAKRLEARVEIYLPEVGDLVAGFKEDAQVLWDERTKRYGR
jgi:hypothetical protein